ncbi:MAG: hypothetical protein Q9226_009341, partial [Calogaya cf. arnoldii]
DKFINRKFAAEAKGAEIEKDKAPEDDVREVLENLNGLGESDSEPRGGSPRFSMAFTNAERSGTPSIAIDLEQGNGDSSNRPNQDESLLQMPTASEHGGDDGVHEGGAGVERSQNVPGTYPDMLEESQRQDSGVGLD